MCAYRGKIVKKNNSIANALSDETHIHIINLIMKRECCLCKIMQANE